MNKTVFLINICNNNKRIFIWSIIMKVLTISIASYNCDTTLEKCLDSMVNANCIDDLEIIVVNDGSKDHTLEIANAYARKYPKSVTVVDKENGGHGSTINTSIVRATGKYFKIVDSDDWVETENLDKLVGQLKLIDDDVIVNSYVEVDYNNGFKIIRKASNNIENDSVFEIEKLDDQGIDFFHMHMLTFATRLVKKLGPVIDENCFYVDLEYIDFLLNLVSTIRFFDYPIYNYLLGDVNQSVSVSNMLKRYKQHETVVKHLLSHFSNIDETKSNKSTMIKRHIAMVIGRQVKLIFLLSLNDGKKEFIDFYKIIPQWAFYYLGIKLRMLMKIIVFSKYKLYIPIVKFIQKSKIVDIKL